MRGRKAKQGAATRGKMQGLKGCQEWVEGAAKGNKQDTLSRPNGQEQTAAKGRRKRQQQRRAKGSSKRQQQKAAHPVITGTVDTNRQEQ